MTADLPTHNRGLHRLALLTALATFPLIFMGGLVTSHDSGLSVPDWPNSYGYNMFLFPVSLWQGGIFYEHAHRLMGTAVGYAAIMLACWAWGAGRNPSVRRWLLVGTIVCGVAASAIGAWLAVGHPGGTDKLMSRAAQGIVSFVGLGMVLFAAWMSRTREPRRWVRWLCVGVLATVIFQGLLGGLRVVLLKLDLAIVHACLAQAFFCLVGLVVIVTSKWWAEAASQRDAEASQLANRSGRTLTRLAVLAWTLIYLQLIVGATMRHYRAGLAIPDLPLAFGQVIPPTDPTDLQAAQVRMMPADEWYHVDEHTLGQVWLAFGHRVGAVVVTVAVVWLSVVALRDGRGRRGGLFAPTLVLLGLLIAQVTLGVLTVLMKKPADVASAHVAVGALVLLTTFVIAVRSIRLHAPLPRADRARGFDPGRADDPIPGGASAAVS